MVFENVKRWRKENQKSVTISWQFFSHFNFLKFIDLIINLNLRFWLNDNQFFWSYATFFVKALT